MGKSTVGCCCGMIIGCLLIIGLLVAAGFGIYYWFDDDARYEKVEEIDETWSSVKSEVDSRLQQAKKPVENLRIPEPKIGD